LLQISAKASAERRLVGSC